MKIVPITRNLLLLSGAVAFATFFVQCKNETKPSLKTTSNETILKAPEGFSVEEIGKDLGAVRHLTVSQNGDIYANRSVLKDGKAIVLLKDTDKDGTIDAQESLCRCSRYGNTWPRTTTSMPPPILRCSVIN